MASADWKASLEKRNWSGSFLRGQEFARYLDAEYATTRAVMIDLGLAKQ